MGSCVFQNGWTRTKFSSRSDKVQRGSTRSIRMYVVVIIVQLLLCVRAAPAPAAARNGTARTSGSGSGASVVNGKAAATTASNGGGASVVLLPLTTFSGAKGATVTLGIGTPPQPARLQVDTGSSNIYVMSTLCTSKSCDGWERRFDPKKSASLSAAPPLAAQVKKPQTLPFGIGIERVAQVNESVSLGNGRRVAVPVSLVVDQSSVDTPGETDGLLGMAMDGGVNATNVPTKLLVPSAYDQGVIPAPVFGLFMDPRAVIELPPSSGAVSRMDKPNLGGELALGGINAARTGGPVVWVDANMNSDAATGAASWRIPNVSLLVDGAPGSGRPPVDLCPKRSCTFLLDSGSSVGSSSVANVARLNRLLGVDPDDEVRRAAENATLQLATALTDFFLDGGTPDTLGARSDELCQDLTPDQSGPATQLCSYVISRAFTSEGPAADAVLRAYNVSRLAARANGGGGGGRGGGSDGAAAARLAEAEVERESERLGEQLARIAIPFVDDLAAAFGDFSCRRTAGGRQLTLAVGGRRLSYGPQTYMLDLGGAGGRCASAFQPLAGLGDDEWLIGMQMLAPVYTAYDYGVAAASTGSSGARRAGGKRRVGFARLAPELEVEAFLTSDLPKFPPPGAAAGAAAAAARLRPEGAASGGAAAEGSSSSAAAKPAAASSGSGGGGRVLGSTMLRGAAAAVALLLLLIV